MILFQNEKCASICLKNTSPYVRLAVEDLRQDFARVSRCGVLPEWTAEGTESCIVIEKNTLPDTNAIQDESFTVRCEAGKIFISAAGYLGTMWGIYTVSERLLGVEPCFRFNDLEPEKKDSLECDDFCWHEVPDGFGFRGVFINDEDLLTGWRDGGGIRYLDYKWYSITLDVSALEWITETVLRLRMNLIIPSSFVDLDNPPEKALVDCAARRGLFVSQHHIEPLGVSAYTFENYCKKYGKTGTFSYQECPEQMEEVWRFYAEKWARYDNVVWQIGLRGKGDRPVWQDAVPTEEELANYGAFIGRAMQKQKEIVLQLTGGNAKFFTSTLWMEGSRLMEKKLLTVPEGTILVFADNGPDQRYGEDYYTVPRQPENRYGIYYHLQFYGCGPHLAPQTGLEKLAYHINLAKDTGDSAYCILNVSNVREFVFELTAHAELMWKTKEFSTEDYLERYCRKYGVFAKKARELIAEYYHALPELDKKYLARHLQKYFNYSFRDAVNAPAGMKEFIIKEGIVVHYGKVLLKDFHRPLDETILWDEIRAELKRVIPEFRRICAEFQKLADVLPAPLKRQVEVKWGLYANTLLAIYTWYLHLDAAKQACEAYDSEAMKASLNSACRVLEEYLRMRKRAEYGVFENWYRGDLKMDIKQVLYRTKMLLGHTPEYV